MSWDGSIFDGTDNLVFDGVTPVTREESLVLEFINDYINVIKTTRHNMDSILKDVPNHFKVGNTVYMAYTGRKKSYVKKMIIENVIVGYENRLFFSARCDRKHWTTEITDSRIFATEAEAQKAVDNLLK
jgi:hypothetical protein